MSELAEKTDEELMTLVRGDHDPALGELVRRHQNDIFRFCAFYLRNADAALDKTQETFIRLYVARERFDTERKFKPWAMCIARNLCLNELQRRKTVRMESLESYASTSRDEAGGLDRFAVDGPSGVMETNERHAALMGALNELNEDARELLMMRYFEQMSARDIAEVVDSTEGAVRTRLHRALNQLRAVCETRKESF